MKQKNNLETPNENGDVTITPEIEKNVVKKECSTILTTKEKRAKYHQKNKEKNNIRCREYRKNNKEYFIKYRLKNKEENKEENKEKNKIYREKTKYKRKEYFITYKKNNKYKIKQNRHNYYIKNKEKVKEQSKIYWSTRKEKRSIYHKQYHLKNKEKRSNSGKIYYVENREHIKKRYRNNRVHINEVRKLRRNNNINVKIGCNLRTRLWCALMGNAKLGSAVRDLGCSISDFRKYIESRFKQGMTWENYGKNGWNLDHIIPISFFDLTNKEELLKAVHYTNIQPLWETTAIARKNGDMISIGNIEKRNKIS